LGCLAALGCKVGPNYERPKMPVPEKFRGVEASTAGQESIANIPWWELFKDEQLRELIKVALEQNRDLKIAVERIEEARLNFGISKADLYPHLNAQLLAGGINPSDGSLTHVPEGGGRDTTGLFVANVGFSWELDFFGRIRRASEAQKAALLATDEARRAVAISLVSDVAMAYVDLRGLDRRLEITKNTLKSRQEHVDYAQTRFEGRVAQQVDVFQAEAEFHRVQAQQYNLEKLIAQKENELSFLVGRAPGEIVRNRSSEDQPVPPEVPVGLPAELLEQRPDVRKAELDLWSATARIGEAKAALYPSIKLTGSYGLASTDLSNLVDPASQAWHIFANLLQPLFQAGKLRGQVEVRWSQQRQAVYAYERTLLQALREVEDALVSLRKLGQQRDEQHQRADAERHVVELAELRYKGGVSTYLEVLDAQRSLFNAEIEDATTTSEHARSLIQLYKALGAGWPVPKDKSASGKEPAPAPAPAPVPAPAPAPAAKTSG
ncbi:MAG TPA: efflux transporter outer membrane subunit, partial [Polyangiaceae bacterium]|nr:efflux transporter outer membrane subunit [Polyangiaceae bacterium]